MAYATATEAWIEEQERTYVPHFPIETPWGDVIAYGPLDLLAPVFAQLADRDWYLAAQTLPA